MEKIEMTTVAMENWMYRHDFITMEYISRVVDKTTYKDTCEYYVRKINESTGTDAFGFPETKEDFCETCFNELSQLAENYMWNHTCKDYIMGLLNVMNRFHLPEIKLENGKSYGFYELVDNWNLFHAENPIEWYEADCIYSF